MGLSPAERGQGCTKCLTLLPLPYAAQYPSACLHLLFRRCSFGGMAGIEAANALYTGELVTLSEQEIVDCDELDYGCDGG